MNTNLFTGMTSAHIHQSKQHCLAEVKASRVELMDKQLAYSIALKRFHDTGIRAGLNSASNDYWKALVDHENAINLHAQFTSN